VFLVGDLLVTFALPKVSFDDPLVFWRLQRAHRLYHFSLAVFFYVYRHGRFGYSLYVPYRYMSLFLTQKIYSQICGYFV